MPSTQLVIASVAVVIAAGAIVTSCELRRCVAPSRLLERASSKLLEIAIVQSLCAVVVVTLGSPGTESTADVQLRPLADLRLVLTSGRPRLILLMIVGNLLLFAPLGAFLVMRWARFANPAVLLPTAAAFSLAIEVMQYFVVTGRTSSAGDVLMNTLGAVIGGAAARRLLGPAPLAVPAPARASLASSPQMWEPAP